LPGTGYIRLWHSHLLTLLHCQLASALNWS